jgi:multiple sugar transport system permease protein
MGSVHVAKASLSPYHAKQRNVRWATYLILAAISFTMVLPFLWMISSSLKLETEVFRMPIRWIPDQIRWANYLEVWQKAPFGTYYWNTTVLTFATVVTQLVTSSLAGYVFARLEFPERDTLLFVYLGTLMVPYMVIMIPQFTIIRILGLYDTLWAVYLIRAFSPFGTFLFRQFFMTIPFELSDSARIDGCSEFRIYRSIIMPLSRPAIATLMVFFFSFTWNDFLGPLIYLTSDTNKTIQLGLRGFVTLYNQEYALLMAAAVIAMLPIMALYVFLQRYFVEGIAMTGLKG